MAPRWIVPIVAALMVGPSLSAHAATIHISMENLVISPAEASAKVGDTIEWINKDIRDRPSYRASGYLWLGIRAGMARRPCEAGS